MNNCLRCGNATKNPKFCSTSCAASFNNKIVKIKKKPRCLNCGLNIARGHKYCNNKCQGEYIWKTNTIPKILRGECKSLKTIKKYLFEVRGEACEACSTTKDWNGKKLTLQADHIDGNYYNNKVENIKILCPNCHSQTDTHSRNKINVGTKVTDAELMECLKYANGKIGKALAKANLPTNKDGYRRARQLLAAEGIL